MLLKTNESILKLKKYFKKYKIAQLKDLSVILHTTSRMTIFRKLTKLNYISSYTHAGAYYSTPEIIYFDADGLWFYEGVGFSQHGNLRRTIIDLIEASYNGKTLSELRSQLHVRVQNTLLSLYRDNLIAREKIKGVNIYISLNAKVSKTQLQHRMSHLPNQLSCDLSDWIVIKVLAAIIKNNAKEIIPGEIYKILEIENSGISMNHINMVIVKLGLKKTVDF